MTPAEMRAEADRREYKAIYWLCRDDPQAAHYHGAAAKEWRRQAAYIDNCNRHGLPYGKHY